jgi:selenocysteine-specific translation elongation factor
MNCQKCGAEVSQEDKYCEYCKTVINPNGKDYDLNGTGECFIVNDIFSIINRSLIIGNAIQPLHVGDKVYSDKKQFVITNMQVGNTIVNSAKVGDNCGLVFSDFSKKDLKRGDKLIFKKD